MTHLDDELLSAHLDGEELPGDDADHLAGCPVCAGRLDALRSVAGTVAARPAPPPGAARDAAVRVALAALEPGEGRVVPFRRRIFRAGPLLAVAAVLAGLVLSISLLTTMGGGDDDTGSLAAGRAQQDQATGPVDGGDVGELADDGGLRRLVEQRLDALDRTAAAPMAAGSSPDQDEAGREAADTGGGGAAPSAAAAGTASELASRCEGGLRATDPRLSRLVYVATLRWQGTPAVLMVFRLSPPEGTEGRFTTSVWVVDPDSECAPLHQQRF